MIYSETAEGPYYSESELRDLGALDAPDYDHPLSNSYYKMVLPDGRQFRFEPNGLNLSRNRADVYCYYEIGNNWTITARRKWEARHGST